MEQKAAKENNSNKLKKVATVANCLFANVVMRMLLLMMPMLLTILRARREDGFKWVIHFWIFALLKL